MRLHRFITDIAWSNDLRIVVDEPRVVHQVLRVLRLTPGEQLLIVSKEGQEVRGTVSDDSSKSVLAIDVIERLTPRISTHSNVHLYCAILKKENFDWVVQKTTELGVATITPLITDRTIKQGLSLERMQTIALEAAEQSGRVSVPLIGQPITLSRALDESVGLKCWADIGDHAVSVGQIKKTADYSLFIGAEGGWSPEEQALASSILDCAVVSLGGLTLRAETAAVVGVYALVNR